jgi:hypothetical protein
VAHRANFAREPLNGLERVETVMNIEAGQDGSNGSPGGSLDSSGDLRNVEVGGSNPLTSTSVE